MANLELNIPVNRVEGDLSVHVELTDNVVSKARCTAGMYRGFENLMVGRAALDGLVLTPRICGICGTAHLLCAALALEDIAGAQPSAESTLVRNIALACEHLQNNIRHFFLYFMPDFTSNAYEHASFHGEACQRYAPFKGERIRSCIENTRHIPEIIAILGGQWPHSSYIVPGGVTTLKSKSDIRLCLSLVKGYIRWLEAEVLGGPLEQWTTLQNEEELTLWTKTTEAANSDIAFLLKNAQHLGLDTIGGGVDNFISLGGFPGSSCSETSTSPSGQSVFISGLYHENAVSPLAIDQIREDVSHSWHEPSPPLHPAEGVTDPLYSTELSRAYTWAKAVRYLQMPMEAGPVSDLLVSGNPLIRSLHGSKGSSALLRILARLMSTAILALKTRDWLEDLQGCESIRYTPVEIPNGKGCGVSTAPRGAVGHWVEIEDNAIKRYQVISPTSWNASPRDETGALGPWEKALEGLKISNPENPVEIGHVLRSFDPCMVCAVHLIDNRRKKRTLRIAP